MEAEKIEKQQQKLKQKKSKQKKRANKKNLVDEDMEFLDKLKIEDENQY